MNPDQHHNALNRDDMLHWYEIKSILGQGGFGITYLARDSNLDRQFAIKEYLPAEFSTRDASSTVQPISENHTEVFNWGKQRFLDEARTLAQFEHPNIIRVHSFFEHNNTGYMVMEYEEGNDFFELIKAGESFDEARLLDIMVPILEGLELVHQQGYVHRDIKPQNIFIRSDGSPVLIDFGSARQAIGGQTRTMTSLVTPGYAPFEQYHDAEGKQGPWTDIYALGATIYCAITGKPPADALKRGQARVEHNTDAYLKLIDLKGDQYSAHFLQAIDMALGFLPTDRPNSVGDLKRMLLGEMVVPMRDVSNEGRVADAAAATLVAAAPVRAETEKIANTRKLAASPSSRARPESKRSWLPALAIGIVLLIAVGAGFVLMQQSKDTMDTAETDTLRQTQAELNRLKAELEARSTELKQAELEKLQRELEDKAAMLEQQEQQRKAEEEKRQQAERDRLEQAQQEKLALEKAEKAKQTKDLSRQQAEKKQIELAKQQAEKKKQAELARQQAQKKKQKELARQAEKEKLALLESQKQSSVSTASNLDVSGTYASEISTTNGWMGVFGKRAIVELHLTQSGNKISGRFSGDRGGEIEATRRGDTITFKWYITQGSSGSTDGNGKWNVSADGNLLEGSWQSLHYDTAGKWGSAKLKTTAVKKKSVPSPITKKEISGTYSSVISFDSNSKAFKRWAFGENAEIEVRLKREGNRITGTFSGSRRGEIEGLVDGDTIRFDWYITGGGNAANGSGKWQPLADGSGFQGTWKVKTGSMAGNWNLVRMGTMGKPQTIQNDAQSAGSPMKIEGFSGTYDSIITGNTHSFKSKNPNLKVVLIQEGSQITGTIASSYGQIWGDVEGNTIKFEWISSGGDAGNGQWMLNPQGTEIVGTWFTWREQGTWNLVKIK